MTRLLEHIGSAASYSAFPLTNPPLVLNNTNWNSARVALVESVAGSRYFSANVDETVSTVWLVFEGSALPASYADRKAVWTAIPQGNGQYQTTFNITSSGSPVRGATVTVFTQAGLIVAWGATDANGRLIIPLDANSYTVSVTATGFQPSSSSVTVSGTSTVSIALTQISVSPPSIPGLCNVLVAATLNGQPIANATATAFLEGTNNTVSGSLASKAVCTATTDTNGQCVLTLIQFGQFTRGGIYRLKVTDTQGLVIHDRKVKVSNTTTANAESLEDAP